MIEAVQWRVHRKFPRHGWPYSQLKYLQLQLNQSWCLPLSPRTTYTIQEQRQLQSYFQMAIQHSLEKAIPFLLARTGISMGHAFTKQLIPFGVSLIEWRVCVTIYENVDSTLSQIAYTCSNDPSTLSRTVNGLINKGFIKRVQSRIDRRSFVLNLSAKGKQVTEKIIPMAQDYEAQALHDFSDTETEQLRSFLKRVHENMKTHSTAD